MRCTYCKKTEITQYIIIPVNNPSRSHRGSLSCIPCAVRENLYCLIHKKPHQGFIDRTHTCIDCVKEKVVQTSEEEKYNILNRLVEILPEEEIWDLLDAADAAAFLSNSTIATCVARFVFTKAAREKVPCETILQKIAEAQSARILFS